MWPPDRERLGPKECWSVAVSGQNEFWPDWPLPRVVETGN
jgi:hypothetical protein